MAIKIILNVPLYYELPPDQQPPEELTSEFEDLRLLFINDGRQIVDELRSRDPFRATTKQVRPYSDARLNDPATELEWFGLTLTSVLTAADHAGLEINELLNEALGNLDDHKTGAHNEANAARRDWKS